MKTWLIPIKYQAYIGRFSDHVPPTTIFSMVLFEYILLGHLSMSHFRAHTHFHRRLYRACNFVF